MNAFEAGERKMIPAVLIYARRPGAAGTDEVLMIHRQGAGDFHAEKWNGLGGKAEPDESMREAARREFREEAGIELAPESLRTLGQLHFPNFKPKKREDWVVTVFEATLAADQALPRAECAEGQLHWVPIDQVMTLNLWPGDRAFLPHVFAREPFCGTIWYRDGALARTEIERTGGDWAPISRKN